MPTGDSCCTCMQLAASAPQLGLPVSSPMSASNRRWIFTSDISDWGPRQKLTMAAGRVATCGTLLIARCNATELFQAVDQALHPIAKPVGGAIKMRLAALVALTWNNGTDATLSQTAPSRWAAVALVARHAARPEAGSAPPGAGDRTPVQDVRQSDLLMALASGQNGRDGPTMAFGAQVNLGREPAL